MTKTEIWANTIVNNEENFIWFSVMGVIDWVDKVLVWDTGSDDKTVEIIKEIKKLYPEKISFKEVGQVDNLEFTKMRQKMLKESVCDWILVLDGDEIWWEDSIKKLVSQINRQTGKDGVVVPMMVAVGDIYHAQEEKAGKYQILGRKGHISLKAVNRKIPGLHVDWPYGKEGYFDKENVLIQERKDLVFLDAPFLHVTHLKRSSVSRKTDKFKYELGNKVPGNFRFPEVLYKSYPPIVRNPWHKISGTELLKANLLTPLRRLKRRIS